jgi:protein-tyrosine-phosphatase
VGEYLLRHYASKSQIAPIKMIEFDSAGLNGGYYGMDPNSFDYLQQKGIHPADFHSKRTNRKYLENFDLILVMEQYMKREILQDNYFDLNGEALKQMANKILLFTEAGGQNGDIDDPYGSSPKFYAKILKQIDEISQLIISNLESEFRVQ